MEVVHEIDHPMTGIEALRLGPALSAHVMRSARRVTLSLRTVEAIDASGVAALVRVFGNLRRSGVECVLTDVPPAVDDALCGWGLGPLVRRVRRASTSTAPPRLRRV